jgi:DNA-binding response OmpR family regulator
MAPHRPTRPVLVVEDDDKLRELFRTTLRDAGFTVEAVSDGIDALRLIEDHVPAAVVLDLALPRLSGRDVAQELRATARTRRVPIIVVTGTNEGDGEGLKADCVLQKPIVPDELVATVDECLRKTNPA